ELIQSIAPGVGDEFTFQNAAIPVVDGQRFEPDLFGKGKRVLAVFEKGSAGCVGRTLIVHQVRVTAPVWFFFEQQNIAMTQHVSGAQPADAASNHNDVVPRGNRWTGEYFPIANLVA